MINIKLRQCAYFPLKVVESCGRKIKLWKVVESCGRKIKLWRVVEGCGRISYN
ncbi:hypothetical protein [Butyrivibrio fibrisolvens]|uniref:hypothetical protein n=1 Tax=Butyrivibrio fibrisolvens TaxID=831 RepID=UPI0012BD4846|nr:hypothetical protein [Butyrivibrio fibrisolvens]